MGKIFQHGQDLNMGKIFHGQDLSWASFHMGKI